MVLAITSVPAVLALTLTLPVVDDGPIDEGALALPMDDSDEPGGYDDFSDLNHLDEDGDVAGGDRLLAPDVGEELHHLVENGFSPLHSPLGRIHHSTLRRMASRSSLQSGSEEGEQQETEELSKELLEEVREEEALEFHRELTAVQCILGPAFCTYIIFGTSPSFEQVVDA